MLVETGKETLCINQIIGQKNITDIIEEDFVVPDIKPDILNSINTSGTVCIYKKDVMDGKIKIDGCINTYIIYLADNEQGQIRSINTNLDFSKTIEFEALKETMAVESNVTIKQIECRVINGRKINIKAIIDIELKAFSNENFDFMSSIKDIDDIQLLKNNVDINSLLGEKNTKVYAKDTIMIGDIDDLAEIMKINIDIKNKENKISYNKILIKADAIVKIMYLTTDNRICTKTADIPVMGFVDMQDVSDDCICDVKYEIKNIFVKPNSIEEHSIYVEIELEANCKAYETKKLELIQDLYSPSINLIYKQNIIKTMSGKSITKDMCPIRENQSLEELHLNKIYDVNVTACIMKQNILKDRIVYEGELQLNFIFASEEISKINSKLITIPFNYNMNCPGITENSKISTKVEIASQDFIVMPDESIDVKIDLEFMVDTFTNQDINLINQIEINEDRDIRKYSIIIYYTKPGDTLWKIAKRFKSTIDAIVDLNGIEDENKIEIGQQIFIPMI